MAHINSFVRIPLLAIRQRVRPLPRIGLLDEDRVAMRVWPNDIDFNFHLNNSRFLTCMDYGRMHMIAAMGILDFVMRERWKPLVGSVFITYRRSLPLFAGFTLTSRVLCWDERWVYMEQTFTGQHGLVAVAWVKGLFRAGDANIVPQAIVDRLQPGLASPPVTQELENLNAITREKLQGSQAANISL
jgi:acyl-CoA thioesterase FadM